MIYSLHVGLNYAGSPYELHGCENDARAMRQALRDALMASGKGWNIQQTELQTGILGVRGFLAAIEQQFNRLRANEHTKRISDIYITFSGHGTWVETPDGIKEGICLWNGAQIEVLLDSDLRQFLQTMPFINIVVILDSCFSGGMSRNTPPTFARRFVPFDPTSMLLSSTDHFEREAVQIAELNKIYYLMACQSYEVAYETDGKGEFTTALCDAVKFANSPDDKTIKSVMRDASAVLTLQNPVYKCLRGNAAKRIF